MLATEDKVSVVDMDEKQNYYGVVEKVEGNIVWVRDMNGKLHRTRRKYVWVRRV